MSYTIRYRRLRVEIQGDKPTHCEACGSRPSKLQFHHWVYLFKKEEILKNPELAKKYGTWLCYPHHLYANALRMTLEQPLLIKVLSRLREEALA